MPGSKPSRPLPKQPSKQPNSTTDSGAFTPLHPLEYEVTRKLRSYPTVKISSLVVRRTPDGICLQGVLESDAEDVEFRQLLCELESLANVVNQLVCCHRPPPKG